MKSESTKLKFLECELDRKVATYSASSLCSVCRNHSVASLLPETLEIVWFVWRTDLTSAVYISFLLYRHYFLRRPMSLVRERQRDAAQVSSKAFGPLRANRELRADGLSPVGEKFAPRISKEFWASSGYWYWDLLVFRWASYRAHRSPKLVDLRRWSDDSGLAYRPGTGWGAKRPP